MFRESFICFYTRILTRAAYFSKSRVELHSKPIGAEAEGRGREAQPRRRPRDRGKRRVPPEPQTAVSSPSRAEVHRRKRATVLSPRCPSPPRTQGSGRVFRARRAAPSGCAPLLPPSRSSHDGRDLRNPLSHSLSHTLS